jgi:hypothetical protein
MDQVFWIARRRNQIQMRSTANGLRPSGTCSVAAQTFNILNSCDAWFWICGWVRTSVGQVRNKNGWRTARAPKGF